MKAKTSILGGLLFPILLFNSCSYEPDGQERSVSEGQLALQQIDAMSDAELMQLVQQRPSGFNLQDAPFDLESILGDLAIIKEVDPAVSGTTPTTTPQPTPTATPAPTPTPVPTPVPTATPFATPMATPAANPVPAVEPDPIPNQQDQTEELPNNQSDQSNDQGAASSDEKVDDSDSASSNDEEVVVRPMRYIIIAVTRPNYGGFYNRIFGGGYRFPNIALAAFCQGSGCEEQSDLPILDDDIDPRSLLGRRVRFEALGYAFPFHSRLNIPFFPFGRLLVDPEPEPAPAPVLDRVERFGAALPFFGESLQWRTGDAFAATSDLLEAADVAIPGALGNMLQAPYEPQATYINNLSFPRGQTLKFIGDVDIAHSFGNRYVGFGAIHVSHVHRETVLIARGDVDVSHATGGRAIIVAKGNVEIAHARNALIIALGNVTISHDAGSTVIAGGDVQISHQNGTKVIPLDDLR